MRLLFIILLVVTGTSFAKATAVTTVQDFELKRYVGTWHEVARYPLRFLDGCTMSTATYALVNPERISVHNKCMKDGEQLEIKGNAIVKGPGKLAIRFSLFQPFRAPYWVFYIDDDYKLAVVGTPDRKNAWILSRTEKPNQELLNEGLNALTDNGFDLSGLIWAK